MVDKIKSKIHGYARRQLTWWRADENAIWITDLQEAQEKIDVFLNK